MMGMGGSTSLGNMPISSWGIRRGEQAAKEGHPYRAAMRPKHRELSEAGYGYRTMAIGDIEISTPRR